MPPLTWDQAVDALAALDPQPGDTITWNGTTWVNEIFPSSITVSNFPATQPITDNNGSITVDGSVSVSNLPATQPVSGPLTDTQLRSTAVPVSGTFYPATQPVSGTVTATGPLTDTQIRATPLSVSGPLTDAQFRVSAVIADASTLAQTGTAAAGSGVTITLPAAGAGLFHYITFIEVTAFASALRTAAAAPIVVTTTNLSNTPAISMGAAAFAQGTVDRYTLTPATPLRSSVANTATTIVAPATTAVIWRLNVTYFTA